MVKNIGRIAAIVAFGTASALAVGANASADPIGAPGSFQVPLVCDNGMSYQVVVNGNGAFVAAHDIASNAMLIPTAFGPFHGVVTDAEGNVLDDFTDPPLSKGNAAKDRRTSAVCTFEVNETFTDPVLGVLNFHGEGTVTVFVTPAR